MHGRPRCDRNRGKRVLLWLVLAFVLGQIGVGLIFDRYLIRVRFPDLHGTVARLQALPEQPTHLVLGSSRIGFAVDDQDLTRQLRAKGDASALVYNAGVSAADPPTCAVIFDEILAAGVRPRVVLLETCPDQVCRRNPVLQFQIMHIVTWHDVMAVLPNAIRTRNLGRLAHSRLSPVSFFREPLREHLAREWTQPPAQRLAPPIRDYVAAREHDWGAINLPRRQRGLDVARASLRDPSVDVRHVAALQRILEQCQRHGIQVILIDPPVVEAHRALYTPDVLAKHDALLKTFEQRCSFQRHCLRDCVPDEGFLDNHHTNLMGRTLFTKALADVLSASPGR